MVRCMTAGSWIVVGQDEYQTHAQLDVIFGPQPQDAISQNVFVDDQFRDIVVKFTANPPPTRVWWILEHRNKFLSWFSKIPVYPVGVIHDTRD